MSKNGYASNRAGLTTKQRGGHNRVFPTSAYWRRQESPRLLEQQIADDPRVTLLPGGRIVGDDADRWLREHSR